jgi:hypothetical protein
MIQIASATLVLWLLNGGCAKLYDKIVPLLERVYEAYL